MNIQPKYKILIIIIFSILFGIGQSIIIGGDILFQTFASTLIPLIIIFIITMLIELSKYIHNKEYRFDGLIDTSWKLFIPIIILLYFSLILTNYSKTKEKSVNNIDEFYKKTVQENNQNERKKVGSVHTEFLNSDNLYENYSHNYTITFPKHYKVNYGIGKYSEVQAYESSDGYIIIVNAMKMATGINPTSNITKNNISDTLMKLISSSYDDPKYIRKLETKFEENGLSEVKLKRYFTTNYNNRIYISSKYTANSIINNIKMPVTLIDNVTFYDDKIYHFCFRSWTNNYNANWETTINNVMASVLINDRIDNK